MHDRVSLLSIKPRTCGVVSPESLFQLPMFRRPVLKLIPFTDVAPEAKSVRGVVLDRGVTYLSIRDLIMAVTGKKPHNAVNTWRDLPREMVGELGSSVCNYQFRGQGQRPQPLITLEGALQLLVWLPGYTARERRAKAHELLVLHLAGNPVVCQEIAAKADEFMRTFLVARRGTVPAVQAVPIVQGVPIVQAIPVVQAVPVVQAEPVVVAAAPQPAVVVKAEPLQSPVPPGVVANITGNKRARDLSDDVEAHYAQRFQLVRREAELVHAMGTAWAQMRADADFVQKSLNNQLQMMQQRNALTHEERRLFERSLGAKLQSGREETAELRRRNEAALSFDRCLKEQELAFALARSNIARGMPDAPVAPSVGA